MSHKLPKTGASKRMNSLSALLLSLFPLLSLNAVLCIELDLLHSLDGGASFTPCGALLGAATDQELVLTRHLPSPEAQARLSKLVEEDSFYLLKVGDTIVSVRAACFAAPLHHIRERAHVILEGGHVLGFAYKVKSPSCQTGGSLAAASSSSLPSSQLDVAVITSRVGLPLFAEVGSDMLQGSQTYGMDAMGAPRQSGGVSRSQGSGGGGAGGGGGPLNRPLGVVPGSPGPSGSSTSGGAAGGPEEKEKTFWEKNWMMIMAGGMLVLNVVGNVMKGAPAAGAPGAATAPGGGRR